MRDAVASERIEFGCQLQSCDIVEWLLTIWFSDIGFLYSANIVVDRLVDGPLAGDRPLDRVDRLVASERMRDAANVGQSQFLLFLAEKAIATASCRLLCAYYNERGRMAILITR